MQPQIIIVGNLTKPAETRKKNNSNEEFVFFTVACNRNAKEVTYVTCFAYGVSKERLKLLTTGTQVHVYGYLNVSASINPSTQQAEASITCSVINLEITLPKREAPAATAPQLHP